MGWIGLCWFELSWDSLSDEGGSWVTGLFLVVDLQLKKHVFFQNYIPKAGETSWPFPPSLSQIVSYFRLHGAWSLEIVIMIMAMIMTTLIHVILHECKCKSRSGHSISLSRIAAS